MINSKCDQNENDSTVWKYAESIIDVANIKETLIEKCRKCGKMFSSQSVLKKHDRICNNPSSEILHEFERIVSVCRDHLTRMMLTYSNDTTRKPLFVAINSHSNDTFREDTVPLQAQPMRPNISCDDSLPHFSTKFSSAGLLNINRSMIQPMMNPYRFHPKHSASTGNVSNATILIQKSKFAQWTYQSHILQFKTTSQQSKCKFQYHRSPKIFRS